MTATPAKFPSVSVIRRLTGTLALSSEATRYGRPMKGSFAGRTVLRDESSRPAQLLEACCDGNPATSHHSRSVCDEIDRGVALARSNSCAFALADGRLSD